VFDVLECITLSMSDDIGSVTRVLLMLSVCSSAHAIIACRGPWVRLDLQVQLGDAEAPPYAADLLGGGGWGCGVWRWVGAPPPSTRYCRIGNAQIGHTCCSTPSKWSAGGGVPPLKGWGYGGGSPPPPPAPPPSHPRTHRGILSPAKTYPAHDQQARSQDPELRSIREKQGL
jgi:hypothetical protein